MIDDSRPIFLQIAELIENDIVDGVLAEEGQVPSTNEFAAFYRINPATAAKGVNRLVDDGILYKKRGIGMFVAAGARSRLVAQRRDDFFREYVQPMTREARKLGISTAQLTEMLNRTESTSDMTEGSVSR
ncbi:GntR family transcriptional regulator [Arthrobacter sulfonylureivorans]|uniref:GntR family transcriptional regulator n=1 Tax=Arthrobacter sulfonylureivorans TaxID=2486855 RepID=UPI0039E3A5E0